MEKMVRIGVKYNFGFVETIHELPLRNQNPDIVHEK